jgi:ribosome hibernation promoting factor
VGFGTVVAASSCMMKATSRPRSSSVPTIEIVGLAIAPTLRARIVRRIRRALVGVQTGPVHVRVSFTDVNGPKGGLDARCAIDVRIPRTAPFHVEETAVRDVTAFDLSAAAISRQIARQLGRREESGRHPKKYYAARRLR